MYVFDTSAYINGRRFHYRLPTFEGVWTLVGVAMVDGRVLSPRAVLVELEAKDDDVSAWARRFRDAFVDPSEAVQEEVGSLHRQLEQAPGRDAADPWVIAEARVREWTVVTYEGLSFDGQRTRRWSAKMPGICDHFGVACMTLPEAITHLGGDSSFRLSKCVINSVRRPPHAAPAHGARGRVDDRGLPRRTPPRRAAAVLERIAGNRSQALIAAALVSPPLHYFGATSTTIDKG